MGEATLRVRRALVVGPAASAGRARQAARLLADRLRRRAGCVVELRDGAPAIPAADAAPCLPLPAADGASWDAVMQVAVDAAPDGVGDAAGGPATATAPAVAALRRRFGGALPTGGTLRPEGFALRTLQ